MYWDGYKEVTKSRVREILKEEFIKHDVKEVWSTNPDDFENAELDVRIFALCTIVINLDRCNRCYILEDKEIFNGITIVSNETDLKTLKKIHYDAKLIFKDGDWVA